MKPETETDLLLLEHIRECIDSIREFTGGQSTSFYESKLVRDAVLRNLQTLAETTQRLSKPLKAAEPDIPWKAISAFRNALTHRYLALDLTVVWTVVERDLPILESAIERMAKAIKSSSENSHST